MIVKRVATVLATLGLVLCMPAGLLVAGRLLKARSSLAYIALIPIVLSVNVFAQILADSGPIAIWLPLGGLAGFVIATILSAGAAFAAGTLVFLLAAVVHLFSQRPLHVVDAFAAFLLGSSSVGVVLLVLYIARVGARGIGFDRAPMLVSGLGIVILTVLLTALMYVVKSVRRDGRRPHDAVDDFAS